MENLENLIRSEQMTAKNKTLQLIESLSSANATNFDRYLRSLLPKAKQTYTFQSTKAAKSYLIKRLNIQEQKEIQRELAKLKFENVQPIDEILIIVEWEKSKNWGRNPRAWAYVPQLGYLTSNSIKGYGYDKECTAVARVLNQIRYFSKLMYELKNSNPTKTNRYLFGDAAGSAILPKFEPGVGTKYYNKIFQAIGYTFTAELGHKNIDIFSITRNHP